MKCKLGLPGKPSIYGGACQWPKTVWAKPTAKEIAARKVASYGGRTNYERYKAEVAAYVADHPGCSTFDIALECHMSKRMVRSLKC